MPRPSQTPDAVVRARDQPRFFGDETRRRRIVRDESEFFRADLVPRRPRISFRARIFHERAEHGGGQIQTFSRDRIADPRQQPESLRVAFEFPANAFPIQRRLDRLFSEMPERRIPDVVRQARRGDDRGKMRRAEAAFPQIRMPFQQFFSDDPAERAADVRDLETVRQPRADVVVPPQRKNLRLVLKPAEGARIKNPTVIPVERAAQIAPFRGLVRSPAPPAAVARKQFRPLHSLCHDAFRLKEAPRNRE